MPVVQSTYAERHGYAVEGMIADSVPYNVKSRLCETAAGIGFGKAVSRGSGDRGVVIGGTLAGFTGVTVKDITLLGAVVDKYAQYDTMGVLDFGAIYLKPTANVADGDPVYFDGTTGAFSNASATKSAAAAVAHGTGNGTYTPAEPALSQSAQTGTYVVELTDVISDSGVFQVRRPDGTIDGQAVVGVAYDGDIKFTIADGSTNFAAGFYFTVAVSEAVGSDVGPIPNAKWIDTADSGALARVLFGAMVG